VIEPMCGTCSTMGPQNIRCALSQYMVSMFVARRHLYFGFDS
jgi:hypothetical protein